VKRRWFTQRTTEQTDRSAEATGSIEEGVRQAVDNCLRVRAGERVVIITDRQTLAIGTTLRTYVEGIANDIEFFVMEDFGVRPIDFPPVMEEALGRADVSIYAAQGAKGELQTFRRWMLQAVEANTKLRHAHMIGITPEIMQDGMCSDYREIQRISEQVHQRVHGAQQIRVVTARGNDFTATFSPELDWIVSDGDIQPGRWKNLPDGEVFTSPVDVEGTVIIDGCLGDFFAEKYQSLEETPVRLDVVGGRAIPESLGCKNSTLRAELAEYLFETDENSHRVGEFAIGTNTGLTRLIYNLLQDEKFPGVHVAFGSPLPAKTGATWNSKAHVDGVLISPTIAVDGAVLMDAGRFCLD
jgi:leucyl aminopeptidase (aminopeptidase T)